MMKEIDTKAIGAAEHASIPDYETLKMHFISASTEVLESEISLFIKIKKAVGLVDGPMKYVYTTLLTRQCDDAKMAVRDISNIFRHSGQMPRSILASLKKRFPRYEEYSASADFEMASLASDHRRIGDKIDALRDVRFEIVERNLSNCLRAIGDKHERSIWMLNAAGVGAEALKVDGEDGPAETPVRAGTEERWA